MGKLGCDSAKIRQKRKGAGHTESIIVITCEFKFVYYNKIPHNTTNVDSLK